MLAETEPRRAARRILELSTEEGTCKLRYRRVPPAKWAELVSREDRYSPGYTAKTSEKHGLLPVNRTSNKSINNWRRAALRVSRGAVTTFNVD